MKKSKIANEQSLKNLDELVEVLDADKLREATGGLSINPLIASRPREDVGENISRFQRLINPADVLRQAAVASLATRVTRLR